MVELGQSFEAFLRAATQNEHISSFKRQNGPRADRPRMEIAPRIFNRRDRNAEQP